LGDWGLSRFHVENNARFFQQSKVEIRIGFMSSPEGFSPQRCSAILRRVPGGR
jgi:hypothetical protein